jgi:hypothetical protein
MTAKGYLVHPMLWLALIRRPVRAWPRVRCRVFFRKPKPGPGGRGQRQGQGGVGVTADRAGEEVGRETGGAKGEGGARVVSKRPSARDLDDGLVYYCNILHITPRGEIVNGRAGRHRDAEKDSNGGRCQARIVSYFPTSWAKLVSARSAAL